MKMINMKSNIGFILKTLLVVSIITATTTSCIFVRKRVTLSEIEIKEIEERARKAAERVKKKYSKQRCICSPLLRFIEELLKETE